MSWNVYRVVLRLSGPMHIGRSKIGNLQRTRHYVTGRTLWGALTMRITRQMAGPTASDYVDIGQQVHEQLAFTYLFLTTDRTGQSEPAWPWEEAAALSFSSQFVGSHAGTALQAAGQSAEANTLHEIEQLLPYERNGAAVYLCGHMFERDDVNGAAAGWRQALGQIQLGGERSYGWGRVRPVLIEAMDTQADGLGLFNREDVRVQTNGERPIVQLVAGAPLPAHTKAKAGAAISGEIEPLVGRIWQDGDGRGIEYSGMCFLPGSRVEEDSTFEIGRFGLWSAV